MTRSGGLNLLYAVLVLGIALAPRPAAADPITVSNVTLVSWSNTSLEVIKDGTSNTILFGEVTRFSGCVRNLSPISITDGTSNTIIFGELTNLCWDDRATLPITRGNVPGITDGTSNTILIGETDNRYLFDDRSTIDICLSSASIADGTSNTILLPENNQPICLQGTVRGPDAAAIAEPASAVLLLAGAAAALGRRRRGGA